MNKQELTFICAAAVTQFIGSALNWPQNVHEIIAPTIFVSYLSASAGLCQENEKLSGLDYFAISRLRQ
ncbi:MAG: hypothetical protein LW731_01445 [Oxalobacteraceae bacterium]|jgi:hypothetical protein|nr:hypothetical protein [Oxalobacteraceae bacterium]